MELNHKQKKCLKLVDKFLSQTDHKIFYLLGYAGTGKTMLMGQIIHDLINKKLFDQIIICAPTHQALNVIESYIKSNFNSGEKSKNSIKLSFLTIHKLLEFKPMILTENGSIIFRNVKESKFMKKIDDKLIIIDECSMISQDMVSELEKYKNLYPVKIIFMGDKMQLPPVGESISKIFSMIDKNYSFYIVLDEIMRTKSSHIKKVATCIRNWNFENSLGKSLASIHNSDSTKSFRIYRKCTDPLSSPWFKIFIKKLFNGLSIILTWKNTTADQYNCIIRQHLHASNDLNNYQIDDHLMFSNYYSSEMDGSTFYTSDMIKIINLSSQKKLLFDWTTLFIDNAKTNADRAFNLLIKKLSKFELTLLVDSISIRKIYSDISQKIDDKIYQLETINRNDLQKYDILQKNIREHIEFYYNKYKSESLTKLLWNAYYKKIVDAYAKLNFGYAITTYKAQGLTFSQVFVDVQDISENRDPEDLQKALYTAATRASQHLGFLLA